jgi:hypothetical protein
MVLLDSIPLWAVYLGTVALILLVAEIGYRIGIWLQHRDSADGGTPINNTMVGSMLALLAFLIAFAIGIVIDQHNGRRAMVVTEANAVGTAYLRAGFLDEADRTTSRSLLREYVEIRLAAAADAAQLDSTLARSGEIHAQLWSIVEDNVRQGYDTDIMGLYIEAINQVIDVHTLRMTAVNLRLPRLVGILLYASMLLSFLLVGVVNSADGKRDFASMLLFAMAFVAVFMIIVDLDRPQQGLINVSQTALSDLLRQMTASAS